MSTLREMLQEQVQRQGRGEPVDLFPLVSKIVDIIGQIQKTIRLLLRGAV
jgi:hypothetical protein